VAKELFPDLRPGPVLTKEIRAEQLQESRAIGKPMMQPAVESGIEVPGHGLRIAVLPDGQAGPGRPDEHWRWAGQYIARKRPDVLINIGDLWDFISVNSHTPVGHVEKEGSRIVEDYGAGRRALDLMDNEIAKESGYSPIKLFIEGNHENRITRYIDSRPELIGSLPYIKDIVSANGWQFAPFLQPIIVGGVAFCHYFTTGVMGRACTAPNRLLAQQHMSCFAGHLQGRQIAYGKRADGQEMTAIISGSFYQHDERYLSPQNNRHWRGMWMLHEVLDGSFDEMAVSISFLRRKFS